MIAPAGPLPIPSAAVYINHANVAQIVRVRDVTSYTNSYHYVNIDRDARCIEVRDIYCVNVFVVIKIADKGNT